MQEETAVGFLSYAHSDDEAEDGRIIRLARKLEREYFLVSGQRLDIFVDRDDIRWGQEWRSRVDGALQNTTFFIPVLTEAFFASEECRREFLEFYNTAKDLGVSQYLLAIRYSKVRDLSPNSSEQTRAIAAKTQFKDWTALRLVDESGPEHRTAVHNLAEELQQLMEMVAATPVRTADEVYRQRQTERSQEVTSIDDRPNVPPSSDAGRDIDDDPYGDQPSQLELIAEFEPAAQRWLSTMNEFSPLVQNFVAPINTGTERLNSLSGTGNVFAAKLLVLRDVAAALEEPSLAIEQQGIRYTQDLLSLDPAVRAILAGLRVADPTDPDQLEGIETMATVLADINKSALETRQKMDEAIEQGRGLARMSRDLRPALKRYESGTRNIADGHIVINEWARTADAIAREARTHLLDIEHDKVSQGELS